MSDNGAPANGSYEFRFILRNGPATNDTQVGPTLPAAPVVVSSGVFRAQLDFGSGIFTGAPRWLEVGVRTNGSVSAYSVLLPLQRITQTALGILVAALLPLHVAKTIESLGEQALRVGIGLLRR